MAGKKRSSYKKVKQDGQPQPPKVDTNTSVVVALIWAVAIIIAALIIALSIWTKPLDTEAIIATPSLTSVAVSTIENLLPSPQTTEATNWAITFSYRFPAGYWSIGTHEYTLQNDCPTLEVGSGVWTNSFNVSENTPLLSGDVYLRLSGLKDGPLESNSVENINPMQTTTAAFSLIQMTRSDAELVLKDCIVSIRWDGLAPQLLIPGLPFEY